MKLIQFTISADGENLGSFTLDPYAQLCLMADARTNKKLTLPQYVREAVRSFTLRDNARHPEGNSYSYEGESPPVDVLHSPKLGLTNMTLSTPT